LAGFSSHKVLAWLDGLADKVFVIPAEARKVATEAAVKRLAAQETNDLKNQIGASAQQATTTKTNTVTTTSTTDEDELSEPMGDSLEASKGLKAIR